MSTKVSILIPVYKSEKYIERCLISVFSQTYSNIEYIIVDDASPDKSMEIAYRIVDRYPQRKTSVHIIKNERNFGIAYTRNILLNNSTGDYIYFVDSDDFIDLQAIEIFVTIAKEKNSDIVRCNYYSFNNGGAVAVTRKPITDNYDYIRDCLNDETMNSLWLLFIRKRIINDYCLIFPQDINGCEDLLMTIKLFYHANIITETHHPLYYYRQDNDDSITHDERTFKTNFCLAVKEILSFLKDNKIYENYKTEILRLMFVSKQNYLLSKDIRDIDKYVNTFPESNSIYKTLNYNRKEKTLFYLAEHNHTFLLKIAIKLLTLLL